MSIKTISRVILAALVVVAVAALLSPASATAGGLGLPMMDQTGCKHFQECGHCCNLEAEQVETSKTCFEVECKTICIPRVVFPWQKKKCNSCTSCDGLGCNNCVHNGARTREVRVIKSSSKPGCPVCEYSWSPEKKACTGACDPGCCDAPCCDSIGAAPAQQQTAPVSSVSATTESETVHVARAPQRLPVPAAK